MPTNYSPGHAVHFIQVKLIGRSPWGWRDGLVRESHDGTHTIDYLDEEGSVTVWTSLLDELPTGSPVRVHERYSGLDVRGTVYSARRVAGGLGPVAEPADLTPWRDLMTNGYADIAAGTGWIYTPKAED